mmetsp:Transcript_21151/g.48976  ORF Transcript_21151/g.48976 Transcript_21151/m.48976 type:complete len:225 (+) Transcript_21151:1497-2171(+)
MEVRGRAQWRVKIHRRRRLGSQTHRRSRKASKLQQPLRMPRLLPKKRRRKMPRRQHRLRVLKPVPQQVKPPMALRISLRRRSHKPKQRAQRRLKAKRLPLRHLRQSPRQQTRQRPLRPMQQRSLRLLLRHSPQKGVQHQRRAPPPRPSSCQTSRLQPHHHRLEMLRQRACRMSRRSIMLWRPLRPMRRRGQMRKKKPRKRRKIQRMARSSDLSLASSSQSHLTK